MSPSHPPRSPEAQARVEAALARFFEEQIAFNKFLGLHFKVLDNATVSASFAMRPDLVGSPQPARLHGGVIASVLDTLGGLAMVVGVVNRHPQDDVEQASHRFARLGTIDLRIDYLRPGVGAHFHAQAQATRVGGRIGSAQMSLSNDQGVLIATGAAAYVVS